MKRIFVITLLIILPIYLLGNGVLFSGNSTPIESRTSYNVFGKISTPIFSNKMTICFDLEVREFNTFGYIFSLADKNSNNIFNLIFTYKSTSESVFSLNSENKNNHISIEFLNDSLQHRWLPVCLTMDFKKQIIQLTINNKSKETKFTFPSLSKISPNLIFGCHDFIVDLPTFGLRNLKIYNSDKSFYFPLNENQGNVVYDKFGKAIGEITNPTWLINESYYWKKIFEKKVTGGCAVNIDDKAIYVLSKDSLICFDLLYYLTTSCPYKSPIPMPLNLGTNFMDKANKYIYVYEINGLPQGVTTFAKLDLQSKKWEAISCANLPVQLHHHNTFFDCTEKRLILFGGFGNQKYNNTFFSYNLFEHTIDTINFKNNIIDPRFYSGMADDKGNTLYIYGGVGNHLGEQSLGKKYYNDLYKIDIKKQTIKKCWELPVKEAKAVANTMIYSSKEDAIYALKYKEYKRHTTAQLYKYSINNGVEKTVGNLIPFTSGSIKTTLSLHHNSQLDKLYCIIQEHTDTPTDTIQVLAYELTFPPSSKEIFQSKNKSSNNIIISTSVIIVIILFILFFTFKYIYKKPQYILEETIESKGLILNGTDEPFYINQNQCNSIFLFGDFTVFNSKGKDITYMFSTKLKYIFIYILTYENKEGVLSSTLNNVFWADKKDDNKIKNLKGVTINHLRKVLSEIEGISLTYHRGFFKIQLDCDSCYCDYIDILKSIENNDYHKLLKILHRGKFLNAINDELFDYSKASIEERILNYLNNILFDKNSFLNQSDIIDICTTIWKIDPVNENALNILIQTYKNQKRTVKALECYSTFVREYEKMIGKQYMYTFEDFLNKATSQSTYKNERDNNS